MLTVVIYALLLLLLYHDGLVYMIKSWNSKDYNYCYLVPFIILYMIWEKRDAVKRLPKRVSPAGFLLFLAALALFWLGELGGEYLTLYLSAWLMVLALCWIHAGWARLKEVLFPLLMIPAMFPLPSFLHSRLSLKLKLLSSQIGVEMMQLAGLSAYREGNAIDLGFTQLQVVDACSGLRYLFPVIILGLLLAWIFRAPFWKRILLVVSTLPLIVLTNSFRIAVTGLLYEPFGPQVAEGFFHDFSGWLFFMVTLAILLVEMWLLNKLPGQLPRPVSPDTAAGKTGFSPAAGERGRKPALAVAVLLLLISWSISQGVEFREKIPAIKPLEQFPLVIGDWRGKTQVMEKIFIDALDLSDYFMIDYENGSGRQINFYTAYYESQRKGESIHSPASCLTGSGWVFQGAAEQRLEIPGVGNIKVNRAFMLKNGRRQLVYYWFPQRGRNLTNAYQLKLYVFWDALTKQRTDGALVRLITPVGEFEKVEDADHRLQAFMGKALPLLDQFLPGARIDKIR
ncbi:MAG: VPLPA-CTERM-specific exosortase XrtD [Deltaproteobacteria bacterium]|nr:VPLPA-CTERM-specific exosortase XrtD [Deltaproteobacteria bacterium]